MADLYIVNNLKDRDGNILVSDIAASPREKTMDKFDDILFLNNGVELRKISYRDLAKAILEEYNETELAGEYQTVQEAIQAYDNDASDKTVTFTEAPERINIESPSTLKELFGRIKKWFTDIGDKKTAFYDVTTSLNITNEGEYVLDATAVSPMITNINKNAVSIANLWARQDYIKITGTGDVGTSWTKIPIGRIAIGKPDSQYFGEGQDANGKYFTIKKKGVFLEVAQTYIQQSSSTPKRSNARVYIDNQNGFIEDNKMGVGVTAYNFGITDNVSAESITIGDATNPAVVSKYVTVDDNNPIKLILAGSHEGNGTMSMTVTLVPLYPIGE